MKGEIVDFCSKFKGYPSVAANIGTGVAIENDKVLTARHVLYKPDGTRRSPMYCVFAQDELNSTVGCTNPNDYSSHCKNLPSENQLVYEIISVVWEDAQRDIAIVELNKCLKTPLVPLQVLQAEELSSIIENRELFSIGHPMGLPLIYMPNSFVRGGDDSKQEFFTDLDVLPGASGAPVFVKSSDYEYTVVGILTHGGTDYPVDASSPEAWTEIQNEGKKCLYERIVDPGTVAPDQFPRVQALGFTEFKYSAELECPEVRVQEKRKITREKAVKVTKTLAINWDDVRKRSPQYLEGEGVFRIGWGDGKSTNIVYQGSYGPTVVRRTHEYDPGANIEIILYGQDGATIYDFNIRGKATENVQIGELWKKAVVVSPESQKANNALTLFGDIGKGKAPLPVTFKGFLPHGKTANEWFWDFGDGTTSQLQSPTHIFKSGGIYTVNLKVVTAENEQLYASAPDYVEVLQDPVPYDPTKHKRVSAVLEYVHDNCDGTYTAHFGYYNRNNFPVLVPIGNKNKFTGTIDRGQPTVFVGGRLYDEFSVRFDETNLVWTLTGGTSTASGTASKNACQ